MKRWTYGIILLMGCLAGFLLFNWRSRDPDKIDEVDREVLGRLEGCLKCHDHIQGFSAAHDPKAIGCSSCHMGKPFSVDKEEAHQGIVLVPSNMTTCARSCGAPPCHPTIAENIPKTLMATARGIVAVNRYVFDEAEHPDGPGHMMELGSSPADSHLRQLCASCHLHQEKTVPGPITQLSRGGGCSACHIHYSPDQSRFSAELRNGAEAVPYHPSLTIAIPNEHCLGCHSRSGRIATNYEGWHETLLSQSESVGNKDLRVMDDGRVFVKSPADVHHERGLACIDCHTWRETMGTGESYVHQEEQVEVSCSDCHFTLEPRTLPWDELEVIDRKLIQLRNDEEKFGNWNYLKISRSQKALPSRFMAIAGNYFLQGKLSNRYHPLKPPKPICGSALPGHERLSCQSCHSSWVSHCITCHSQYDPFATGYDHLRQRTVKGSWTEYRDGFFAQLPTLGIRFTDKEEIHPFIPGMIISLSLRGPDNSADHIFKRLYAPTSPHTTATAGRSCVSCHTNPLALGYGRGHLLYEQQKEGRGRWSFIPEFKRHHQDNKPIDAWIDFLESNTTDVSTRRGARPFTRDEQEAILRVGACLTCHEYDGPENRELYHHFKRSLQKVSPQCILPVFSGAAE